MFEPWVLLAIALIGLLAGMLGGMLGVGGSVVMIPAMVLLFGQGPDTPGLAGGRDGLQQHLYQAAAMIVNIFVAIAAVRRHGQAGVILPRIVRPMTIAALVCVCIGVWASNLHIFEQGIAGIDGPVMLGRVMAVFLLYVVYVNLCRLFRPPIPPLPIEGAEATAGASDEAESARPVDVSVTKSATAGSVMGLVAGLLGIGGGAIAVPLQQALLKLPLRNCIGNSAAVMMYSAFLGAIYKNATLAQHGSRWTDSIMVAAMLAPTAILGSLLGGRLTHILPIQSVRVAFIALMLLAAWRMAGI